MKYVFNINHLNYKTININCKVNNTNYTFKISSIGNQVETEWWNEYKKYFYNKEFYELLKFLYYVFYENFDNIKINISHSYLDILIVIIRFQDKNKKLYFPMEFKKQNF